MLWAMVQNYPHVNLKRGAMILFINENPRTLNNHGLMDSV